VIFGTVVLCLYVTLRSKLLNIAGRTVHCFIINGIIRVTREDEVETPNFNKRVLFKIAYQL
jgi:hypothetical protein